ncbi:MAG: aminoglycoside phosphotransferase [Rhodovulum sp.]|jgi:N-acetylmuramate 1-kinase|nr:aminoglycoside phosphotransferase [Rhodovulum sp.]
MTDRETLRDDFLTRAGWGDATRAKLAGDASNRSYDRLTAPDGTPAVLMNAPAEKGEDTRPFIRITKHLRAAGLSAPRILAEDVEHGFLLLEDLGDDLFARVLERQPDLEMTLYTAATDVLLDLHQHPLPEDLKPYGPIMAEMGALAVKWYAGKTDAISAFQAELETVFSHLSPAKPVLIQRDYHAENLLWLPRRTDSARVGLLDYQDAMSGHPAYDLVSMLQDARRDVSPAVQDAMVRYYADAAGLDEPTFRADYAILGAQRNLRILGVFARLCLHYAKPHYVDLIPRVWDHLQVDLAHPILTDLRRAVDELLPPPTPERLATLKAACGTIPTPS